MNGCQWNRKRFTLPAAASGTTQSCWSRIFGSEKKRKEKLKKAIEEQNAKKKKTDD